MLMRHFRWSVMFDGNLELFVNGAGILWSDTHIKKLRKGEQNGLNKFISSW